MLLFLARGDDIISHGVCRVLDLENRACCCRTVKAVLISLRFYNYTYS